ncbi:MAG: PEGA domain-containing protein [Immundisolibacteraceae bacterium]|nr:PEGA domain-containing protein [Immundisolibacteraceae bacterium]
MAASVRIALAMALLVFVAGCQQSLKIVDGHAAEKSPPLSRVVTLYTSPRGGEIVIEPLGRQVASGARTELPYGTYQLTAEKAGFRAGILRLRFDGATPSPVEVPLGEGFAQVTVDSEPAGALLSINGRTVGTTPLVTEISDDSHLFEVDLEGFRPLRRQVDVIAGQPVEVELVLQPLDRFAAIDIATQPAAALLRLDGELVGHSPLTLRQIPPGRHHLYAELIENGHSRLSAEIHLDLNSGEQRAVTLLLEERKPLLVRQAEIEPAVQDADSADEDSLTALAPQRVEPSVIVAAAIPALSADEAVLALRLVDPLRADFAQRAFVESLFALLRIGDGVDFYVDQRRVGGLRKQSDDAGRAFFNQLAAAGIKVDNSVFPLARASRKRLTNLLFRLYRQRGHYPLLELAGEQQSMDQSIQITRLAGDGEVVLLGEGQGLQVDGIRPVTQSAGLSLYRFAPADGEIDVRWRDRPGRLLVTAAASPAFRVEGTKKRLALREKRLLNLSSESMANSVEEVTELSAGPEYRGWQKQRMVRMGNEHEEGLEPLIEIGPHQRPGRYERTWIIRYRSPDGNGQRQMSLVYQVGDRSQSVLSDQFLRRDGFSRVGKVP